jgi:methylmalonyl-CoA mutase
MTDTTTVLAGDFATPTREQWDNEVLKVLNRRRPPGTELTIDKAMARLRTTTVDGLVIEPLYTETDGPALGVPGSSPFTRGTTVKHGDALAWDVRQLHEDPSVAATNAAVLEDLRVGGTSIWLRVGEGGIAAGDVSAVLAGVIANLAPVAVSSTSDQAAAADALLAWWGDQTAVAGNLGIDPLGLAALHGTTPELGILARYVAKTAHLAGVKPIVVDVRVYDDAGAGDVDQLAYAVATGIEYVRALAAAGVSATDAFAAIDFRVTVNADQFLGIARLRASASSLVAGRRGAGRARRQPRRHPARRHLVPHDHARRPLGEPASRHDRQLRRRRRWRRVGHHAPVRHGPGPAEHVLPSHGAQHPARRRRGVQPRPGRGPGGGLLVRGDAAGGMAAALAAGTIASQITATLTERRKRLASRKQPVTGVSMFPPEHEEPIENLTVRPSVPAPAGLQPLRDSQIFEALRDRVSTQTRLTASQPGVFLACLGERRDFGPREQFTSNVLLVAGLAHPTSEGGTTDEVVAAVAAAGVNTVILCSSAKVYAGRAIEVATALKKSGTAYVWIAGRKTETGSDDVDSVIDGEVFDGMDVAAFLSDTLDRLGVAK